MNEYRNLALDLAGRFGDIEHAMLLDASLFNRETVLAVRDFAQEGQRQRGGSVLRQDSNSSPEQIAEDFATSLSRIDALTNKLRRSRFSRDALLLAGLSIRAALTE
jgi:hypothetical protein